MIYLITTEFCGIFSGCSKYVVNVICTKSWSKPLEISASTRFGQLWKKFHTYPGILMKPMKPLDMTVSETLDRKPFFVTEKKINIYVKPFSQDKCYDLPLFLSVVAL